MEFNKIIDETFHELNKWFNNNLLSLNLDKAHFIPFKIKNACTTEINVKYSGKSINPLNNIKFLGIYINDTLNWTTHLDQLTRKLSAACYAIKVLKHLMRLKTLIMIYYAYFHNLMNYGVIPLILSTYLDYKKGNKNYHIY
jgi:hypothetical protein